MEVEWGDQVANVRYKYLLALLGELEELHNRPNLESKTFKRVRQAKRYELWRIAHPYKASVAVRIIVWFPSNEKAVLALFAFDKAKLGDIWYDRATRESEANLDQWRRENPEPTKEM